MLTVRCKQFMMWSILALLLAAIIPLPAQASDYGTEDLVKGSQGAAVTQLQTDLAELDFYTYKIDGSFGPKTYNAVVNFQKSQGLKTDGVVGPITKAALNAALNPESSPQEPDPDTPTVPAGDSDYGTEDLVKGSQGTAVTQLQTDLASLGFYTYKIDGSFGPKTYNAVVNFQKSQGLKTDGVVGPITKAALNAALKESGESPQDPDTPPATEPEPTPQDPDTPPVTDTYTSTDSDYNKDEKPIVDAFRASYDGSTAQALVGRAIWYMEYGFMKYGHTKYATTGYIDCSNFVSLVYKDFGYSITSAAKNYNTVGVKVDGVYAEKISGSSKYHLVGIDKLKPGDIFTYWNSDDPARTHIGHVAIYMGVINGKPCIINTCSDNPTAIGIIDSFSYWYGSALIEVRRVLPDSAYVPGAAISPSGPVIPAKYQIKPDQPIIMPEDLAVGF
ncbi:MAG: peptidoglycan-binding protein [Syntrophomonadaceae bacterium]|nr:peptidoglycan-binding protein [Syntrophomonadaceae bacterium]